MLAELFIAYVIFSPLLLFCLYAFLYPEDAMLLGQRWKYDRAPEFSDEAIFITKVVSLSILVIFTIVFFVSIYSLILK